MLRLVLRKKFQTTINKRFLSSSSASTSSSASFPSRYALPISLLSLTVGFVAGRQSFRTPEDEERAKQLPNGYPLACCGDHITTTTTTTDCDNQGLTAEQEQLIKTLKRIVGKTNLLDGRETNTETSKYLKGARLGRGTALAIVRPNKLKQIQEIVQEAAEAGCAVLVQGSNTGLTGGSVPRHQSDGRPTIIISMKKFDTIFPIDDGERVVCLAGAGLASLKTFVEENFPDRESHSILGSTFLNPTTAAGVAFGSGGTQIRKGPACTERALYLKVEADKYGKHIVKVVNTLGIEELDSEEGEFTSRKGKGMGGVIQQLDSYVDDVKNKQDNTMKISNNTYGKDPSHDYQYKENLCTVDSGISRFNADTKGLECNRSEGKVLILATVHDTFKAPPRAKSFWMSFVDLDTTIKFKTEVCLDNPSDLPVSIEYMDRDSFDVIDRAGRIMGLVIKTLGTDNPIVSKIWDFKLQFEALDFRGAATFLDKVSYFVNPICPPILPKRIMDMGRARDHHVATVVGDYNGSLGRFEERFAKFCKENEGKIEFHECKTASEQNGVTAFRFIAAPAFKTFCVGTGLQGISVDYALPKNHGCSPELPASNKPVRRMRYSHFGCNVVHEDIAYEQGVDTHKAKMELKHVVDEVCKGRLPAEHGHGTEYHAPKDTQKRWQKMDPLNVMNPGVGGLSTKYRYEPETKG